MKRAGSRRVVEHVKRVSAARIRAMAAFCMDNVNATKGAMWPFLNLYKMASTGQPENPPDEKGTYSGGKLRPYNDKLSDYIGVQFGSVFKIVLAAICWTYTVDMTAAAQGYDFSPNGWVAQIVLRDLSLMVIICGGWHWLQ